MPRTRREMIQRRLRQADHNIFRAQQCLAEVHATYNVTRPEYSASVEYLLYITDQLRRSILRFHRNADLGVERDLYDPDDLRVLLRDTEPIPMPKTEASWGSGHD